MNILQAINQKSFESSFDKAVVNLLYTHNWYRDKYQSVFKPYGLKMQHYNVLRILKGNAPKPLSPGKIKEVMLDKSPDLTRLIDKMVDMGLINRELCPDNRRKMDVYITDKGLETVNEIKEKQNQLRLNYPSKLTENEAEILSDLLDKLRS